MTTTQKLKISNELLDELLNDYKEPSDLLGRNGIFANLQKRLLARVLNAEMDMHLGYGKHDVKGYNSGNSRNGTSKKQVLSSNRKMELEVPRDRNSEFEPKILPKGQKRFDGFDQQVTALYARGMSTRDIRSMLEQQYGGEVSASLISQVTESVMEDVLAWQNRPLETIYPIVYLDAIRVKTREDSRVLNKSIYLALGVNMEGKKGSSAKSVGNFRLWKISKLM